MRPKTVVVYPSLNPAGGAENVTAVLTYVMHKKLGLDVTLSLAEKPTKEVLQLYRPYLTDVKIACSSLSSVGTLRLGKTAIISCNEFRVLLKHKYDLIVNTGGIFSPLSFLGNFIYVHFPLFYVNLANNRSIFERTYNLGLGAFGSLLKTVLADKNTEPEIVAANSGYTLSALEHFHRTKNVRTYVLYPPVDVKRIMRETSYDAERENIVLTISRISREKELLIIPEIAQKLRDIRFVVLGRLRDARYFETFMKRIRNNNLTNVKILTNATEDKKLELLQKSKVYLHTMPFEQFGISIVEGMAAGLTPISHDSGGPKEFVTRNQRYKEPSDLIEKIYNSLHSWNREVASQNAFDALKFDKAVFESKASELIHSLC